jgi:NAD(P)-dependent dehydrogenase (short-subunit alcohol dehydrogenase family)
MYGVISPDFRIYTDCARKNSEIYGATKAAIIQMTRYFAVHLAQRNIRVNAISPGGIFNPQAPQGDDFIKNYSYRCPMQRMARADEMVGATLYLASDAASYTTGQNIVIDGGMSCW